jgi:hypothetical protein
MGCKYPFAQYAAGPPVFNIIILYITAPRDSQAHSLNKMTDDRHATEEKREKWKDFYTF